MRRFRLSHFLSAAILATVLPAAALAQGVVPLKVWSAGGRPVGQYSERTLVVALDVRSVGVELLAFTVKERPYQRPLDVSEPRPVEGGPALLELVLWDRSGRTLTQHIQVRGLCLDHPFGTPSHVEGDTVRVHRETVLAEFPELPWFDRVEVALWRPSGGAPSRVPLGSVTLAPERFTAAGGPLAWCDLSVRPEFAYASIPSASLGTVHWPEEYGDTDLTSIEGSGAETDRRINIVVIPDGYTYAEKSTMQTHFRNVVEHFRGKTPFQEHDPFVNYILVYAYSTDSGTDQCDCNSLKNTPMNTGFPKDNPTCGHSDNRCLYYGWACGGDTSEANLVAAELRAPAQDISLVMVNTARYGGCGGYRAVYSAGDAGATEVAVHELGHSLANLDDEYSYTNSCGTYAGELNTSKNSTQGAWPEWIADIGAPKVGAQYYQQCIYRPETSCDMRSLDQPFCRVCDQQWALTFFGHGRVSPTAPVSGLSPESPMALQADQSTTFAPLTRLSSGAGVTHDYLWQVQGPGYPTPTTVGTEASLTRSFSTPGTYTLTCRVTADTNFVKPTKTGANRDTASWTVNVSQVLAAPTGVTATASCTGNSIAWTNSPGATSHNVLRGAACGTVVTTFTGATTPYNDTTAVGGTTYHYWVVGVNSYGTSANSDCATAVRPESPAPTVAGASANTCPSSAVLLSTESGKGNYQWYVNGAPIGGANAYQCAATATGSYTVSYTEGGGCPGTSAAKAVAITPCLPSIVFQSSGSFTQVTGDGDAWYEKGEKWSVQVTMRNAGNAGATGVTANLAGNGITLCNNPGVLGAIAASGTATFTYEFLIDATFSPCGGAVGFDITGKACAELTPAGSDEMDRFSITVGQQGAGVPTALVVQPSSADSWVNQSAAGTNYGTAVTVDSQRGVASSRRALVLFDLSGIPAGSTIHSATLELYASSAPTAGQTLDVHRITGAWTETGVTWTTMPTFTGTPDASVAGGTAAGWKVWNVLPVVQGWHGGTNSNYGFLVKCNLETGFSTYLYSFGARENGIAGNRPILRLNYTPPTSWDCSYAGSGTCGGGLPPEIAPGTTPATSQNWTDKTTQVWPSDPSATGYKLYRGTQSDLPALLTPTTDSCTRYVGAANSMGSLTEDPTGVAGGFYWYLVTGTNGNGEGPAGSATGGVRILNTSVACP